MAHSLQKHSMSGDYFILYMKCLIMSTIHMNSFAKDFLIDASIFLALYIIGNVMESKVDYTNSIKTWVSIIMP